MVFRMIKNKRIKKNWSEEDVNILIWVISKYCQFHGFLSIKESLVSYFLFRARQIGRILPT